MSLKKSITAGVKNGLADPFGTAMGIAWWILCVGLGAWVLQMVISFAVGINGF
jgi:threonine/homoserine/homoserine lactone efflux protein